MRIKHVNNGNCAKCDEIFNLYPGFYLPLKNWFKNLQKEVFDAHISEAGRGKAKQDLAFKNKTSKAIYGKSAHNYNAAIDIFRLLPEGKANYLKAWYLEYIIPRLTDDFSWGGYFVPPDCPHVQVKNWRELLKNGVLKIVE